MTARCNEHGATPTPRPTARRDDPDNSDEHGRMTPPRGPDGFDTDHAHAEFDQTISDRQLEHAPADDMFAWRPA